MSLGTQSVIVRGTVTIRFGGHAKPLALPTNGTFQHQQSNVEVTLICFEPGLTQFEVICRREVEFIKPDDSQTESDEAFFERCMRTNHFVHTGPQKGWTPDAELWRIAWAVCSRLALVGKVPQLLEELRVEKRHLLLTKIIVAFGKTQVPVVLRNQNMVSSPSNITRALHLERSDFEGALARVPRDGEHLVIRADQAMTDPFGISWYFATLCTAMETTAYAKRRALVAGSSPPNFSPKLYFGRNNILGLIPLIDLNFEAYKSCCELWGARHELLHNGLGNVRNYDPKTEDANRGSTRRIGGSDRSAFREGVLGALEWLQLAPASS